jgi:hypothetical protein
LTRTELKNKSRKKKKQQQQKQKTYLSEVLKEAARAGLRSRAVSDVRLS